MSKIINEFFLFGSFLCLKSEYIPKNFLKILKNKINKLQYYAQT